MSMKALAKPYDNPMDVINDPEGKFKSPDRVLPALSQI